LSKKSFLVGLSMLGIFWLGYGFTFDLIGGVDYQFASFPQLTEAVITPLNQAISTLNSSLPADAGSLSPLPPLSGAWSKEIEAHLWLSPLWGVGLSLINTTTETSATSTLNVEAPDAASFKLDVSYKLAISGLGGGLGAQARISFGPLTAVAGIKVLYLLGNLTTQTILRAHDFSDIDVEPPDTLNGTLKLGYQTMGWGYETTLAVCYTFGWFSVELSVGYRNVPFTFADLDGDGLRERADFGGLTIGGRIGLGL